MTFLEPVSPYPKGRRYTPQIGHVLTVELPGERIRAEVKGVVSDDACVCVLLTIPTGKTPHGWQKGDTVCVRRDVNWMGSECWTAISEREMQQREQVVRFEEEEKARLAAAEAERVAKIRAEDLADQAAVAGPPAAPAVKRKAAPRKPVRAKRKKQ